MPAVTFTVEGCPIGKARARVTSRGVFTPPKTRSWEGAVRLFAKAAMRGAAPFYGIPLAMTVTAYLPIPPSWSQKRRAEALAGTRLPIGRPDGDNLLKAIADSCNKIIYWDDALVTDITIAKRYSDRPRVEVTVQPLAEIGGLPHRARAAA